MHLWAASCLYDALIKYTFFLSRRVVSPDLRNERIDHVEDLGLDLCRLVHRLAVVATATLVIAAVLKARRRRWVSGAQPSALPGWRRR